MPYPFSKAPRPNFKRVLRTGDPRHCCRAPQSSATNSHTHTNPVGPGAEILLERRNEIHGSVDTYYKVLVQRECNVAVLPAIHSDIVWQYDVGSSRQCARPYVRCPRSPTFTNIVKCAKLPNGKEMRMAVHPQCWDAIMNKGPREIPGDVIARLCKLDKHGRAAEIEHLRAGAQVCCYFKP